MITSPQDSKYKKVKTTQGECRAHEKQNLASSSLLNYGKGSHGEKPHIWDSLDPDRYVGTETKILFQNGQCVSFYLPNHIFSHIYKITSRWLAAMQVHIFPALFSQNHFSLQ